MDKRMATCMRTTRETDIELSLCLDGGECRIDTGVGFFDHMLQAWAVHAGFGLTVSCKGDLQVDAHHTVEDVGMVLGDALAKALGDRAGIVRYGSFYVPMDEALAFCSLDVSGRPYLVYDARFPQERTGDYDTCLTVEFFRAVSVHAGLTLHIRCAYGQNAHHMIEAMFKAFGHALSEAVQPKEGLLSTKGTLA